MFRSYNVFANIYTVAFFCDYTPTFYNGNFAIINTQLSNMQGEHCIMIANSCQILCFADSLGRKMCSFLKQQIEQTMSETLEAHPSVCGFYTINAAFHLFNFRQEKITGAHHVDVLSFISNNKYSSNFS